MYDLVAKRKLWFAISALLTIPGIFFILLGGLRPSIDFTGGTEWEVRYAQEPTAAEVEAFLIEAGYDDPVVTPLDDGFLRIRTEPIDLIPRGTAAPSASPEASVEASPEASATADPTVVASPSAQPSPTPEPTEAPIVATGTEFAALQSDLEDRFGAGDPRSVRTVGPIIGADLIRSSIIIIVVGELFILGYLWMRFGLRFGTAAIIALVHDVLLVVGVFAILGYFFGFEFDALFVTALLTVIGFSVHDTIVVFDRIRENRVRHSGDPLGAIVNRSLLQTLSRSVITSLTVMVPLAALLLLGPPTISTFTFALLIGILAGTYSSIFVASQILVEWDERAAARKARERTAARA